MVFLFVAFLHLVSFAASSPSPDSTSAASTANTASNIRSGLSVGVGWPYVGLKYYFNNDIGSELRFATGEGINVYSARGYWSFARFSNFSVVGGLEAGYVTFNAMNANNTLRVSGDGYEFAPFCGMEYFLNRQFSFLFDFSMPIVGLTSRDVSLGDQQWVVNGGLYFYPF